MPVYIFDLPNGTATRIPCFKKCASSLFTLYVKVCLSGIGRMTSIKYKMECYLPNYYGFLIELQDLQR